MSRFQILGRGRAFFTCGLSGRFAPYTNFLDTICGLSWGDVDLDERTVTVAHSFDRTGNLKSPKTGAGVHPKVMQELAGHANSQITMDIYTHVDMTGKRAAAEALQAYFEDNRGPQEQQPEAPKPTAVPPATADEADEAPMFTLVPVSAA